MMNDLTFNILKIIVSVVMALIAYYVIPYIKRRLESDKYQELLEMINIALQSRLLNRPKVKEWVLLRKKK